jgi:hypothetical protein
MALWGRAEAAELRAAPFFGNTNCSVGGDSCQNAGTVDNYYFTQPLQFSGPTVAVVATGGTFIERKLSNLTRAKCQSR